MPLDYWNVFNICFGESYILSVVPVIHVLYNDELSAVFSYMFSLLECWLSILIFPLFLLKLSCEKPGFVFIVSGVTWVVWVIFGWDSIVLSKSIDYCDLILNWPLGKGADPGYVYVFNLCEFTKSILLTILLSDTNSSNSVIV